MSNSAAFFVPAARSCARVRLSCSPRPCPRLRCRGRRNLGGNPGSSNPIAPRTRGGWSADRRTLLLRRACEARPPCPGATGTPLGAPPWRFSAWDPRRQLRQWHRICAAACPPPAKARRDGVPGLPRCGSRRRRGTPLLRTLRTITESQFVVMRRSDSGVGDSGALRMGVGRSHDRRGGHLATMGSGRLEAR
jgi:hypothetical protein